MSIAIRIGIDRGRKSAVDKARELGAPILVSANTLWNAKSNRFRVSRAFDGLDLALDSGGFVAMKRYGGYRWTPEQYLGLAQQLRPQWYAQMDFCCEPQIASDRKAVFSRIDATVDHLVELEKLACERDMRMPMPVLQGWEPQDYCSGPIFDRPASLWPRVVGVGSVCRRHVHGPHGILAIVRALDAKCPEHVRFHLFGAKGTALDALVAEFPERIESIDSMAWNYAARWECFHSGGTRDTHADAKVLERWYRAQCARLDAPCQLTIKL